MRTIPCLLLFTVTFMVVLSGCASITGSIPKTEAENVAGYTYVPLDPFPIPVSKEVAASLAKQSDKPGDILKYLPDNTVRVSVETFDGKGNVSFGPVASNVQGSLHRVTTDYTVTDAVGFVVVAKPVFDNGVRAKDKHGRPLVEFMTERQARIELAKLDIRMRKRREAKTNAETNSIVSFASELLRKNSKQTDSDPQKNTTTATVVIDKPFAFHTGVDMSFKPDVLKRVADLESHDDNLVYVSNADLSVYNPADIGNVYTIPVYVGIGLRISADVRTTKGGVNVSALASLGVQAEAGAVRGTLVAQTLGVNGEAISAALPIQSELNATTIQNSLVAVGSIKALLYGDKTTIRPRVVGMYIPFRADKELVNIVISLLHEEAPTWTPFGFEQEQVAAP